jgi:hypothetical protein
MMASKQLKKLTGDGKLLQRNQRSTDTRGSELGVEHWHQHRKGSNTHTSEPTAS